MKTIVISLFALMVMSSVALAEECIIEDWKSIYQDTMQALIIEGVTTCKSGQIQLRLYDGEGDGREFFGVETGYIQGYIFEIFLIPAEKPNKLSIEYNIDGG